MAEPLDRAFVEILPDFSQFGRNLQRETTRALADVERRFRTVFNRIERSAGGAAEDIASEFSDAFDDVADDAQDAARAAENALDDIDVPDVDLNVDVDPRQVDDEVDDAVRRVRPPTIPVNIDVDREGTFSRFISSITGVRLPIAGFLALGSAVGAAAVAAVQLTAAMAPAVGIIAAAPAAIGVFTGAVATLQVALLGVGDAFTAAVSGDAQEFAEALETLAPSAQAAAQTLRDITPLFQELQQAVQQEFFVGFDDTLQSIADTLIGPLTTGMTSVASQLSGITTRLGEAITSAAGVAFIESNFAALSNILANIQEPLGQLVESFLNLGTSTAVAFGGAETAGESLASLITRFADFVNAAAESGAAVDWVSNAITVFQQLGAIISPVVGIIGALGDAAAATGGNILGAFGEGLEVFETFLQSAAGMDTLIALFETFNTIGGALGDVLVGIGPALPPIINGINNLVSAVAPLIAPLAELVGTLLIALAPIFDSVTTAITPLIGPITQIIELLGPLLVQAIELMMPWVETLLELFAGQFAVTLSVVGALLGALAPIFTALTPLLMILIEVMTPIIELFGAFAEILGAILVPIIEGLGAILLWLVETVIVPILVPAIEFLAGLFSGLLSLAVTGFGDLFITTSGLVVTAFNLLRAIWQANTLVLSTAWRVLSNALQAAWNTINSRVFSPIKSGINTVRNAVSTALGGIRSGFNSFVTFVKGVPGRISGSLSNLFSPLASGFRSAINSVIDGWNSLSFTVPSVDLGALGSVGGFTVSTPNIPRLQVGGMSMGEGLAYLDPNEAILPLEDRRTESLLAGAIEQAMARMGGGVAPAAAGVGDINVDVRIGETPLNDIVDKRIDVNNRNMVRRARSGTRRNN